MTWPLATAIASLPMLPVLTSLFLALGQLGDARVLRVLLKSAAMSLVLFAVLAWGGWYLLDAGLERAGLSDTMFAGAGALRGLASALMAVLGLWLSWRIVAMAVIQFFADEVVLAVERRHYPRAASTARELSTGEQLAASLKTAGRALLANLIALPVALALLFTGIGPAAVFLLVNAWLLGRELQDMVWLRHRRSRDHAAPVSGAERLVLGGTTAVLLVVPFVNFLAPVLGAASATHLVHRKDWS